MLYVPLIGLIAAFGSNTPLEEPKLFKKDEPYKAPDPKNIPKGTTVYGRYGPVKGTR
jgi:hypothetical protein